MATEKTINEQIKDLQERINASKPKPVTSEKSINEQIEDLQRRLNKDKPKSINEQIEDLRRRIRGDEREDLLEESAKQNEEYILDLSKRIEEKRIILNYMLDELIKLREQRKEENIISYLEDEFERLRKERHRLEERLVRVKEHMRC